MVSNPEAKRLMATATPLPMRTENGEVVRFGKAVSLSGAASYRLQLVRLLVLAAFTLCMSAPEELFYSQTEAELNPFAGIVKLALLGLGIAILLLCEPRKRHWAIAGPFAMLMGWAVICWMASGAEVLPARNLVSSFGGILVLAAFCAAADYLGGIRPVVRLMVWALLVTASMSILLGIMDLEPLPGQSRLPGE